MSEHASHRRRRGMPGTLAGQILIAHPILDEEQFAKTVLFVECDTGKSVSGIILNRPLNVMLKALGKNFENLPVSNTPVYFGGQDGETTVMLTAWVFDNSKKIFEIYCELSSAEAESLRKMNTNVQTRAFLGYCDFDAHLYDDIRKGLWIVGDTRNLFGAQEHEEKLWQTLLLQENPNALVYR
ncbi:MAG: YqgE/AlgH family protein [Puniceicoccales bacterium]|nr:YqgE/AlgH family protein [Puniceicoccales bacterium]